MLEYQEIKCSRCKKIKSINDFYRGKIKKNGYRSWCKACSIDWQKNNLSKTAEYMRMWKMRSGNLEKAREWTKRWKKNNPQKMKEGRERFLSNNKNKISNRIASAMWGSLINGKDGRCWEDLVGYTLEDLMFHLEKQFRDGMSWNNYGQWHIDHIIPINYFIFKTYNDKEFKRCWDLTNLQPLWAKENLKKGSKIYEFN